MRLNNKVSLITGGNKGIGKTTALLFAKEGATVIICDINEGAGKETLAEIKKFSSDSCFFKANVSDYESVSAMLDKVLIKYGKVDVLVNNAGITKDAMAHKMSIEQFNDVIDVNLKGVFNLTRALIPSMREKECGVILNISSVVGIYGNVGQTNYAASKAGVIGMTKTWAKELGKKGIRANVVAPGFIISDMSAKVPEKILNEMKSETSLGRLGEQGEVANLLLFLASDEASYITGQVIGVDGGLVL